MKYIANETQAVLESKTLRIESRKITENLHLTTVLLQISNTEYCHYAIGVFSQESGNPSDFRIVDDITRDRTEAYKLFALIVNGGVTPCTLVDVLQDIIGVE